MLTAWAGRSGLAGRAEPPPADHQRAGLGLSGRLLWPLVRTPVPQLANGNFPPRSETRNRRHRVCAACLNRTRRFNVRGGAGRGLRCPRPCRLESLVTDAAVGRPATGMADSVGELVPIARQEGRQLGGREGPRQPVNPSRKAFTV